MAVHSTQTTLIQPLRSSKSTAEVPKTQLKLGANSVSSNSIRSRFNSMNSALFHAEYLIPL